MDQKIETKHENRKKLCGDQKQQQKGGRRTRALSPEEYKKVLEELLTKYVEGA